MPATPGLSIHEDDLSGQPTRDLVALHLAGMVGHSPPGHSFALDVAGLKQPDVTFWSAWFDDDIAGIGALRTLGRGLGEIKSMRTHPDHLGNGVGAAILDHIVAEARRRGLTRVCLETGSGPAFEAALALYRKRGFREGPAFADYAPSAFNQFLHLEL